jgi:tRNA U34 2-thiouridine synthase MnmA/TrmU
VIFDQVMEGAVAPGQAAVFYQGETVVGGGWIA